MREIRPTVTRKQSTVWPANCTLFAMAQRHTEFPSTSNWVIARTRFRHEKIASQHLDNIGIRHLLPLYRSRSAVDGSVSEQPLFPGYVFVCTSRDRYLEVVTGPGLADLVSFANGPYILSQHDLEKLRRCELVTDCAKPCQHISGDHITIAKGPFEGLAGTLIRNSGSLRLIISINAIHRSIEIPMNPSTLASCRVGSNSPAMLEETI